MFVIFFSKPHFNIESSKFFPQSPKPNEAELGGKHSNGGVPLVFRVHLTVYHTQISRNQASWSKHISLPLLKNFCIWRRNSKSLDVNQKGVGKHLG